MSLYNIKIMRFNVGKLEFNYSDKKIELSLSTKKLPLGLRQINYSACCRLSADAWPENLVEEVNGKRKEQLFSIGEDNFLSALVKTLEYDWNFEKQLKSMVYHNGKKYSYTVINKGYETIKNHNFLHLELNSQSQQANFWLSPSEQELKMARFGSKLGLLELQIRNK